MARVEGERSPAFKLLLAILIGMALSIPLFSVWLMVYDRQTQSEEATASITQGWGGPQAVAGPFLVVPYKTSAIQSVVENGQTVTRTQDFRRELTLSPEVMQAETMIRPERRKRSIYEVVVYDAQVSGRARFSLPPDLPQHFAQPTALDFSRAELRFGVSDPRGLGANARVIVNGKSMRLQPGGGSTGGRGFYSWVDASALGAQGMDVEFRFDLRGNGSISLVPQAGDTRWHVRSTWPSPSFGGEFLPAAFDLGSSGFNASYRIGNLALGRSLMSIADNASQVVDRTQPPSRNSRPIEAAAAESGPVQTAAISLIQPVDLYSQVNRATKYGFLFIGFTFLVLLMFDVIAGVRISPVEYLLMGAALVLFFVLLLAFAEVIGFTAAYILASVAIAGLNTAYSAAVLKSWRRAALIGGLLLALYAVLYILLSLEAYSLLIGSLLLFAALAGVMYATRRIDWSARRGETAA